MKKITYILIVLSSVILLSCEPEEISTNNTTNNDSIPALIDSSQLEHNLEWNGHYYLLEFDMAYAYLTDYNDRSMEGGAPSNLVFTSFYKDKYSNLMFELKVNIGQVIWSSTNYEIYNAAAVQEELNKTETKLTQLYTYSYTNYGTRFLMEGEGDLFRDQADLVMTVNSFATYYDNNGRWARFNYVVEGENIFLDLNGRLLGQNE